MYLLSVHLPWVSVYQCQSQSLLWYKPNLPNTSEHCVVYGVMLEGVYVSWVSSTWDAKQRRLLNSCCSWLKCQSLYFFLFLRHTNSHCVLKKCVISSLPCHLRVWLKTLDEDTSYAEFQGGASSFRRRSCQSVIPFNAFFIDASWTQKKLRQLWVYESWVTV